MLRFGLLKYKKLSSGGSHCGGDGSVVSCEGTTLGPWDDNGNQQQHQQQQQTSTPVHRYHQHPQQIHNQLNGNAMKNNNRFSTDSPTNKSSSQQHQTSNPRSILVLATSSPSHNYKPLNPSKSSTPAKKRTSTATTALNCKARIYKCIKRILKRNNFPKEQQKVHPLHQQQQQVPDKSKVVDYREIKSLLEKEKPSLDYDVNLAKCVDKPALIKKIALNLLKSAEDDDRCLVIAPERQSETTSIQSDLTQEAEYQRLCAESWFHENLPRALSLELLVNQAPGSFIVRRSTTKQDCYALSLRVPPPGPKIAHYLIVRTASDAYQIKGFHKEFSSLQALIVHHSVMPEALPVPLAVPRPTNLAVKTKCEDDYDTVYDLSCPETTLA
ncbi:uncharacterized protein LOC134226092 [Armigeres subalbatus]|uniref:uncharacterized protein LOC134226092 n=1 Tax=Armigeres subalbatus TaxID=124917 RepID=UPI002ED07884